MKTCSNCNREPDDIDDIIKTHDDKECCTECARMCYTCNKWFFEEDDIRYDDDLSYCVECLKIKLNL